MWRVNDMRTWIFFNGIKVIEEKYKKGLSCFCVTMNNEYLGYIYPTSIEHMKDYVKKLEMGYDPVTDRWEDGLGNICNFGGWGKAVECGIDYDLDAYVVMWLDNEKKRWSKEFHTEKEAVEFATNKADKGYAFVAINKVLTAVGWY